MGKSTLCAAIMALLLGAGSASAHHAFARDFDKDKPVTLNGKVTKVQWANPHVYTFIDVKDDKGKTTNWKIEMGSPSDLMKAGWTRTRLKAGEMVTLQGWAAKNGTNFANAEEMTMPDGQKLSAASSNDRAVSTSGSKTPAPKGTTGQTPRSEPKTVNPD